MRTLISALAAAGILMFSLPGYSADDVKTGGASDKPGRAIEDGSVKSGGASTKAGRAVEDSSVKSGGASTKPGRTVDSEKKPAKKKKKKAAEAKPAQ
jgi:hypothetical protein